MRNKIKLKKPSSYPSLLPGLNFTPEFLHNLLWSSAGGWGMVLWSVHHMLYLTLLPPQGRTPHTLPLLQHELPPVGHNPS